MKKLEKVLILRLNKIGKNPHLVSDRETLESDWRQMNALLKALSVNTDPQSPNANAIEDNLRELVRLVLLVCLNSVTSIYVHVMLSSPFCKSSTLEILRPIVGW